MKTKKGYLNLPKFGKLVGVSRQRIYTLIKQGKLDCKIIDGKKYIDPDIGVKQYEENRDKTALLKNPSGLPKDKIDPKKVKDNAPPTYEGMTTADAERKEKVFKARMAELKYLEQSGKLVYRDIVEKHTFEIGRKWRDAMLNIPGRFAHEWAGIIDPNELENKAYRDITEVLDKFVKENK